MQGVTTNNDDTDVIEVVVVEQRTKKQTQNCNKKIPWRGRYPSLSRKTKVEEAKAAPTYIARAHAMNG